MGKCRVNRPRSRHCDRLKRRQPGYPLKPQTLRVLRERGHGPIQGPDSRGAFLLLAQLSSGEIRASLASQFLAPHRVPCGLRAQHRADPPRAKTAPPAAPALPTTREVTDEAGRTIRVPLAPSRIVSLAPSLTETIYALGLRDRLVGDTDYCDYPPDAQKKPKVGGGINPNLEVIASLHPRFGPRHQQFQSPGYRPCARHSRHS